VLDLLGCGADFMRGVAPDVLGLPPHRVFAASGRLEFRIGESGPELVKVRTSKLLDDGSQKPSRSTSTWAASILAAGNTNGDLPMLQWTAGNAHRTLATDSCTTPTARESTPTRTIRFWRADRELLAAAADGKWTVADMAADWADGAPPDDRLGTSRGRARRAPGCADVRHAPTHRDRGS